MRRHDFFHRLRDGGRRDGHLGGRCLALLFQDAAPPGFRLLLAGGILPTGATTHLRAVVHVHPAHDTVAVARVLRAVHGRHVFGRRLALFKSLGASGSPGDRYNSYIVGVVRAPQPQAPPPPRPAAAETIDNAPAERRRGGDAAAHAPGPSTYVDLRTFRAHLPGFPPRPTAHNAAHSVAIRVGKSSYLPLVARDPSSRGPAGSAATAVG